MQTIVSNYGGRDPSGEDALQQTAAEQNLNEFQWKSYEANGSGPNTNQLPT